MTRESKKTKTKAYSRLFQRNSQKCATNWVGTKILRVESFDIAVTLYGQSNWKWHEQEELYG